MRLKETKTQISDKQQKISPSIKSLFTQHFYFNFLSYQQAILMHQKFCHLRYLSCLDPAKISSKLRLQLILNHSIIFLSFLDLFLFITRTVLLFIFRTFLLIIAYFNLFVIFHISKLAFCMRSDLSFYLFVWGMTCFV